MKFKKPKFWDYKKPNLLAYILFPLSKIIDSKKIIKKEISELKNIKKICIGNIYIGGTGKTSLAIEIKNILTSMNYKCCFIKKSYEDQIDEQKLLSKNGGTISNKSRIDAVKEAIKQNYQVAIFDDGLQDSDIKYDISFICFNKKNFVGNGFVIPAGPLRQSLRSLKDYKYYFLNGNDESINENSKILKNLNEFCEIFDSRYSITNKEDFDLNDNFIAFSGIGNHSTFIETLRKNNFNVLKDVEFPDHYQYSENDIKKMIQLSSKLNAKLLTTEKDYFRINKIFDFQIKYVKTKLNITEINNLKKLLMFELEKNV